MKRSGVIALLTVAAVALIGVNAMVYLSSDRKGPEIKLPLGLDTYYVASGKESLLKDVTATDNHDGDVTDTIRVASILPNADNTEVTVTYTAKDSSNNVTKMSKTLAYNATSVAPDADENQSDGQGGAVAEAGAESGVEPVSLADQEAAATESDQEQMAALPSTAPRFMLTTHYVTIPVGQAWHYYDYIADITDDRDSKSRLSGSIQLSGDVDTSTPGVYEVVYHVTDSNGNNSNYAKLTVTVQ